MFFYKSNSTGEMLGVGYILFLKALIPIFLLYINNVLNKQFKNHLRNMLF